MSHLSERRRNNRTRVRLADVAARVGVSPITISRALRHPDKVSPELRQQILQVIDEMGYIPDLAARALASRHSGVISILAPVVTNPMFTDIMHGINARLQETGLQTQFANTLHDAENERLQILSVLGQNPAGLIMVGPDRFGQLDSLFARIARPVAFILDHSQNPDRMAVTINHEAAGAAATRYLLSRGYRRIGFIGGSLHVAQRQRAKGYEQVLRRSNCSIPRLCSLYPSRRRVWSSAANC